MKTIEKGVPKEFEGMTKKEISKAVNKELDEYLA